MVADVYPEGMIDEIIKGMCKDIGRNGVGTDHNQGKEPGFIFLYVHQKIKDSQQ
jgi:hypothetical protein